MFIPVPLRLKILNLSLIDPSSEPPPPPLLESLSEMTLVLELRKPEDFVPNSIFFWEP